MVSRPELGSDPPFGSDRESGRDSTHPWRVYVIPYEPICIRVSLHWVLTVLLSL